MKKKRKIRNTALIKPLKFERISEIVPLINDSGLTVDDIALLYRVHKITVLRWVKRLRDNGYEVNLNFKRGRPKLKV